MSLVNISQCYRCCISVEILLIYELNGKTSCLTFQLSELYSPLLSHVLALNQSTTLRCSANKSLTLIRSPSVASTGLVLWDQHFQLLPNRCSADLRIACHNAPVLSDLRTVFGDTCVSKRKRELILDLSFQSKEGHPGRDMFQHAVPAWVLITLDCPHPALCLQGVFRGEAEQERCHQINFPYELWGFPQELLCLCYSFWCFVFFAIITTVIIHR